VFKKKGPFLEKIMIQIEKKVKTKEEIGTTKRKNRERIKSLIYQTREW